MYLLHHSTYYKESSLKKEQVSHLLSRAEEGLITDIFSCVMIFTDQINQRSALQLVLIYFSFWEYYIYWPRTKYEGR